MLIYIFKKIYNIKIIYKITFKTPRIQKLIDKYIHEL